MLELRRMILGYQQDATGRELDIPGIRMSVKPSSENLPEIVQRPGKKLRSIHVPCSMCGVRAGSPCLRTAGPSAGEPWRGAYHDTRKASAGVLGTRGGAA